jgi:hypothetical protein
VFLALVVACGVPAVSIPKTEPIYEMPVSSTATTDIVQESPVATITTTPTVTSTPAVINPLTGLPVEDISLIQRRPFAVKVSNYPRTARPQAGLSYADLLIEFYQEYGMTRWHALYLSRDVEKVGPIRSARKIDARLIQAFQSYLVFCAAHEKVWNYMEVEDVKQFALYYGPITCPAMCPDPSQIPINQFYANTTELRKQAKWLADQKMREPEIIPDLNGMVFSEEPPKMSGSASSVRVRFLTDTAIAEWRYNPADQKYYRWSETDKGNGDLAPLTDRLTKKQLSVSNLVVVFVNYIQRQGAQIYELELFGGGKALFFRNGMAESGFWRMPKVDRPMQFFGPNGPFYLHPGVTWIVMVDDYSTQTQDGDAWRIEFSQPGYRPG